MISKNDVEIDNVWAVIVTYNRKDLLSKCLQAVMLQTSKVEGIIIIDNASTDGTPTKLFQEGFIDEHPPEQLNDNWKKQALIRNADLHKKIKSVYVRMQLNTGGAGGFYEGIKTGYEIGAKWIWLMDDDGLPSKDCLENLLCVAKHGIDYVAPNLINEKGKSHFDRFFAYSSDNVINFKGGPFNGILLSRSLIKAVGYPMKNFFLWGDEYEYTDRIRESGLLMVTVKSAVFYHKTTRADWRTCKRGFYIARNNIYRSRLFKGVFMRKALFRIEMYYMVFMAFWRFFFHWNFSQALMVIRGFIHGLSDNLSEHQRECCWRAIDSHNKSS